MNKVLNKNDVYKLIEKRGDIYVIEEKNDEGK